MAKLPVTCLQQADNQAALTLCFVRRSFESGALMSFLRTFEGAEKRACGTGLGPSEEAEDQHSTQAPIMQHSR